MLLQVLLQIKSLAAIRALEILLGIVLLVVSLQAELLAEGGLAPLNITSKWS